MDFNSLVTPFIWTIAKFILVLCVVFLIIGMLVGLATYGRPLKKRRKEPEGLELAFEFGVVLSHFIINKILSRNRITREEWQSDRKVIAYLRGMKPTEFEEYTAKLFQSLGYNAQVVGGSSDGGIDVVVVKDGIKHYVQCKKYITSKVSVGEMRDFYGAITDKMVEGKSFFVTTNIFTHEAEQFAADKPIELIDQFRLIKLIRSSGLAKIVNKNVPAKETHDLMCPNCGNKLVSRKGKRGEFIGCSSFPKCRYTRNILN